VNIELFGFFFYQRKTYMDYSLFDLLSFRPRAARIGRATRKVLFHLHIWVGRPTTGSGNLEFHDRQPLNSRPQDRLIGALRPMMKVKAQTLLPNKARGRPKPRTLLCMGLLNTRSVRNKVGLIHDVIDSGKLDILSLSETWLLETASPAEKSAVIPNGYEALFTYRQRGGECCATGRRGDRGGGLALIYRSTYEIEQINSSFRPTTFELLIAQLSH